MKAAATRARNAKHAGSKKHAATSKHRPSHTKKSPAAHGKAKVHVKHLSPKQAKARALSLGDVSCCSASALGRSLRLAGWPVGADDVLALHWAATGGVDTGASIPGVLEAALRHGLAGVRPVGFEPFPLDAACSAVDDIHQGGIGNGDAATGQLEFVRITAGWFDQSRDGGLKRDSQTHHFVSGCPAPGLLDVGHGLSQPCAESQSPHAGSYGLLAEAGPGAFGADVPGEHFAIHHATNSSMRRDSAGVILGLDLPEAPHAVCLDPSGAVWSWGGLHDLWPDAVVEEAWRVVWPSWL